MEKYEIGRFYATSFNDIVFEFIVFNNNTIDCPKLGISSFNRIGKDFYYTYDAKGTQKYTSCPELIGSYDIDEDLFDYLKQNGMIRYSTDMAYLYGFSDKNGYDSDSRHYGVGSPYKWAKKKGPILIKQKKDNLIRIKHNN